LTTTNKSLFLATITEYETKNKSQFETAETQNVKA